MTHALRVISAPGDVTGAVRDYGNLESAGWKGEAGSAIHLDNDQGAFYQDLLRSFARAGHARMFHLDIGGRLAASRLTICCNQTLIILKTTYAEDLADLAPGRLLLHEVLKTCFDDPQVRVVEFYTNANRDQLQWSTHQRLIEHHNIYRWSWLRRLAELRSGPSDTVDTGIPDERLT